MNNVIIKKITNTGLGFRNEKIYMPALFHVDDGMLIYTSVWEMERMIQVLVEVAGRSGMSINISKCRSMIFRGIRGKNVEKIGEIDVVHELNDLGIIGNGKTKCFKRHKEKIKQVIKKSQKKLQI